MKEFNNGDKWIVIILVGTCYAILVRVAHHFISIFHEGIASIVVFFAVAFFIWFVVFET